MSDFNLEWLVSFCSSGWLWLISSLQKIVLRIAFYQLDDRVENFGFSEGTGAALKNIKCPYVHTTHLICNIWAAKVALCNPLNSWTHSWNSQKLWIVLQHCRAASEFQKSANFWWWFLVLLMHSNADFVLSKGPNSHAYTTVFNFYQKIIRKGFY